MDKKDFNPEGLFPDDAFFSDLADIDDSLEFILEVDEALLTHFTGTKWEEPLSKLDGNTPMEERLALYQAMRAEEALPAAATYFLISWTIEDLAQEKIDDLYESQYAARFEKIAKEHGLGEGEFWEPGEGPAVYQALDKEFTDAANAIIRAAFQKYGEHQIAADLENDPEDADRKYEAGEIYLQELIEKAL